MTSGMKYPIVTLVFAILFSFASFTHAAAELTPESCEKALLHEEQLIDKGYTIFDIETGHHQQLKNAAELTEVHLRELGFLKEDQEILDIAKPNEFIILRDKNEKLPHNVDQDKNYLVFQVRPRKIIARHNNPERDYLEPFLERVELPVNSPKGNSGFKFMNIGLKLAYVLATHPEIPFLIIEGVNGSGKNTVVVKAGLDLVEKHKHGKSRGSRLDVDRMLITRRPLESGDSIGLLKGGPLAKMIHYLSGFINAYNFIRPPNENPNRALRESRGNKQRPLNSNLETAEELESIFIRDEMEMGLYSYVRGNTFKNALVAVDESGSISKDELKLLGTRTGEGSKTILLGDIGQIDDKKLSPENNALTIAKEYFRGEWIFGHVKLTESIRSETSAVFERVFEKNKNKVHGKKR